MSQSRLSLRKMLLGCFSSTYRAWHSGISPEVKFWDTWMEQEGGKWRDEFLSRCDPDRPLQQHVTNLIDAPPGARIHLLDVGAGPLTALGKKWEGRDVHVTAVDPLAEQYDELLAKHGITPLFRTTYGEAENLRAAFPADCFDLVYAQNSIDHCLNPLRAIQQMLRVVKAGCYVFLAHAVNEGKKENYVGFHQWDLFVDKGDFFASNRRTVINITNRISRMATVEVELPESGWVNARIRERMES
jgi:SAM-dependent methyltransferase